jgi:Methyltransferase domain
MSGIADDLNPERRGYSLASVEELINACLDAVGATTVLEVGAFRGDLTARLLEWAERSGGSVAAIDPVPPQELLDLLAEHPELELIRETSHETLASRELADVVIIDGDHNYYTLSEELVIIDERSAGRPLPLLMFHDVWWPHARRDTYYEPDRIPEEHRQPLAHRAALDPEEPGVADYGLEYEWAAAREGGPRNGVLTALEDFVEGREDLRLAVVPAFFGFGVLWQRDAPWAGEVAAIIEPWDRNPVLARLEAERIFDLCTRIGKERQLGEARAQLAAQEDILRELVDSSAFGLGDRLSRLRGGGRATSWRQRVSEILAAGEELRARAEAEAREAERDGSA